MKLFCVSGCGMMKKKKKLKGKKDEKRIWKGRKTEGRQPNILYSPEDIVHDYSLCIYSL